MNPDLHGEPVNLDKLMMLTQQTNTAAPPMVKRLNLEKIATEVFFQPSSRLAMPGSNSSTGYQPKNEAMKVFKDLERTCLDFGVTDNEMLVYHEQYTMKVRRAHSQRSKRDIMFGDSRPRERNYIYDDRYATEKLYQPHSNNLFEEPIIQRNRSQTAKRNQAIVDETNGEIQEIMSQVSTIRSPEAKTTVDAPINQPNQQQYTQATVNLPRKESEFTHRVAPVPPAQDLSKDRFVVTEKKKKQKKPNGSSSRGGSLRLLLPSKGASTKSLGSLRSKFDSKKSEVAHGENPKVSKVGRNVSDKSSKATEMATPQGKVVSTSIISPPMPLQEESQLALIPKKTSIDSDRSLEESDESRFNYNHQNRGNSHVIPVIYEPGISAPPTPQKDLETTGYMKRGDVMEITSVIMKQHVVSEVTRLESINNQRGPGPVADTIHTPQVNLTEDKPEATSVSAPQTPSQRSLTEPTNKNDNQFSSLVSLLKGAGFQLSFKKSRTNLNGSTLSIDTTGISNIASNIQKPYIVDSNAKQTASTSKLLLIASQISSSSLIPCKPSSPDLSKPSEDGLERNTCFPIQCHSIEDTLLADAETNDYSLPMPSTRSRTPYYEDELINHTSKRNSPIPNRESSTSPHVVSQALAVPAPLPTQPVMRSSNSKSPMRKMSYVVEDPREDLGSDATDDFDFDNTPTSLKFKQSMSQYHADSIITCDQISPINVHESPISLKSPLGQSSFTANTFQNSNTEITKSSDTHALPTTAVSPHTIRRRPSLTFTDKDHPTPVPQMQSRSKYQVSRRIKHNLSPPKIDEYTPRSPILNPNYRRFSGMSQDDLNTSYARFKNPYLEAEPPQADDYDVTTRERLNSNGTIDEQVKDLEKHDVINDKERGGSITEEILNTGDYY